MFTGPDAAGKPDRGAGEGGLGIEPAFDKLPPARPVTGIITERGVVAPADGPRSPDRRRGVGLAVRRPGQVARQRPPRPAPARSGVPAPNAGLSPASNAHASRG